MQKPTRSEDLSVYVDSIVNSTLRTDNLLSKAIKKWKFLLVKSAVKVSTVIHSPAEDVLAELLVELVRARDSYSKEQYRYKGSLYDLVDCSLSEVRLKTPEFSGLKNRKDFIVSGDEAELVVKAHLSDLVYHNINQTSSRLMRDRFTRKKGFEVVGTDIELTKVKVNTSRFEYQKREVARKEKVVYHSSLDEVSKPSDNPRGNGISLHDIIPSGGYNPEEFALAQDMYSKINEGLSGSAQSVLDVLVRMPDAPSIKLQEVTGLNTSQLKFSKHEIYRQWDVHLGSARKRLYSPFAIYKGQIYQFNWKLNMKNDSRYVHLKHLSPETSESFSVLKSCVDFDNLLYRQPLHFRRSV